jgi:hypothetical protein
MCLPKSPAERRYVRRIAVIMAIYVVAIFSVSWTFSHLHPHGPLTYLLAILPALPILGVIATFGIYLAEEEDEFVRTVMVQSSLWSTGLVLGFATFWGFLQSYTAAFNLPMYWVFILWWAAFGLVQPLVRRRYQ